MHYVTVTEGLISVRIESTSNYKRSCLMEMGDNTFIVSYELAGKKPKFSCIQFIERSPAVIAMNESEFSDMEDDELCQNMKLNDRPLVLYPGDYYEACPPLGGYHMQVYNPDGSTQCNKVLQTPRLESNCDDTSHMFFDFKNCFVKRLVLGMRGGYTRNLYCTGTWTDGPNTFVILARKDLANYWCFRFPTNVTDSFDAYLFSDVVCERGDVITESETYAKLSLTKKVVTHVCEDSSDDCQTNSDKYICENEQKSSLGAVYCKKSCFDCDPKSGSIRCNFGLSNNTWNTLGLLKEITLNGTKITLKPMGEFECAQQMHGHERSHVIVRYNEQGCFPQTYCISFKQLAPSVAAYKLFKGPDWPHYYGYSLMCTDHHHYNQEFPFFTHHWTPALLSEDLQLVPCRIPAQSYTFKAKYPDGTTCQGRLHKPDCGRNESTSIVIDSTSCSHDHKISALRYTCHADVPNHSDTGRFLFVKEWGPEQKYLCFYINFQMSLMVILPGEKCYSKARHIYSLGHFRFLQDDESNPCITRHEDARIIASVNEGAGAGLENIQGVSEEDIKAYKKSNNLFSWLSAGCHHVIPKPLLVVVVSVSILLPK